MTHYLKTINPFFSEAKNGTKRFELRVNDRDFKVDDMVCLQEYDPVKQKYSGKEINGIITYVLDDFAGLVPGYCIFGYRVVGILSKGTSEFIFNMVCQYFSRSPESIKQRRRTKQDVLIRQLVMKLSHVNTKETLSNIGETLGGYGHANVLHGIKQCDNRIFSNKAFREQYYELNNRVKTS